MRSVGVAFMKLVCGRLSEELVEYLVSDKGVFALVLAGDELPDFALTSFTPAKMPRRMACVSMT